MFSANPSSSSTPLKSLATSLLLAVTSTPTDLKVHHGGRSDGSSQCQFGHHCQVYCGLTSHIAHGIESIRAKLEGASQEYPCSPEYGRSQAVLSCSGGLRRHLGLKREAHRAQPGVRQRSRQVRFSTVLRWSALLQSFVQLCGPIQGRFPPAFC
jgi:hypothetical protein